MGMLIISGLLGFFVYDVLRVHKIREATGHVIISFNDGIGIAIHLGLYACAAIVGVFANLDVASKCCAQTPSFFSAELVASYMRAFAIGLGGPAAISRWSTRRAVEKKPARSRPAVDDLSQQAKGFKRARAVLRQLLFY